MRNLEPVSRDRTDKSVKSGTIGRRAIERDGRGTKAMEPIRPIDVSHPNFEMPLLEIRIDMRDNSNESKRVDL